MDTPSEARPRPLRRVPPVLGLLLLSPVCAEYLIGYDTSVGRPLALLGGLLFLVPLYGTVAVLVREAVRRTGGGWPSVLLLSLAFGVVQAGLVDQGLFNPAYRDIDSWDSSRVPTLVPAIGVSVDQALVFLVGHMVWSFAAPIAVTEALAPRDLARRPWLGWLGVSVLTVLWLAAAALLLTDHVRVEGFLASPGQLGGAALAAVLLAATALLLPRWTGARRTGLRGRAPAPWAVGALTLVAMAAFTASGSSWAGSATKAAALGVLALALWTASGMPGWSERHTVLVAGAPLVVNGLLSFVVEPLGDPVPPLAKYGSNAFFALVVIALVLWGYLRSAPAPAPGEDGAVSGACPPRR